MTLLQAFLLGIVQGATEFLPVSSSGHLVIAQNWLGLAEPQLMFDVLLHLSTLAAVIFFFRHKILALKPNEIKNILIGSIPAALAGILAKNQIEAVFGSLWVVGLALLVTGFLNLMADKKLEPDHPKTEITLLNAFKIGVAQAFALVPGISRSGSTVSTGLLLGISRLEAFQFSFLLSIPAISGAGLLQLVDVIQMDGVVPELWPSVVGGLAAFCVGLAGLHIFKWILKTARLEVFGWYCILLGLAVLVQVQFLAG